MGEIENLLASCPLDIVAIKDFYENVILENAIYTINNSTDHKIHKYVEEFVANSIYLLEMGEELDSRLQLEVAKEILAHDHLVVGVL